MAKHEGLVQRRALSQVFLRAEWPGLKVAERLNSWHVRRVLEVGPGGGILTKTLLANKFKVTAVEKDRRFAEKLRDQVHGDETGQLQVVEQDFLQFDLASWFAASGEPSAIVGNIPYSISSPILVKILPHIASVKGAIFLVQLEFGQRLVANPNSKAYGSLSVFTQLRAKPEMECRVDRGCFSPVPRVDSALVSFRAKASPLSNTLLSKVETVTRSAFNQRRKILRNAIKPYLTDDLDASSPFDLNRRPETLWPEEFVLLTKHLFPDWEKDEGAPKTSSP